MRGKDVYIAPVTLIHGRTELIGPIILTRPSYAKECAPRVKASFDDLVLNGVTLVFHNQTGPATGFQVFDQPIDGKLICFGNALRSINPGDEIVLGPARFYRS